MDKIENPKDLAKMLLAKQSMNYAKAFIPLIKNHIGKEESAIAYGALCACYARPFKKSNGFDPIPIDLVCSDFLKIHHKIIHYRDKVFSHADSGAEINGVSIHRFEFVSDGSTVRLEYDFALVKSGFIDKIDCLIGHLYKRIVCLVDDCLNSGPLSQETYPAGKKYLLNVNKGKGDRWLIEVPPSASTPCISPD